MLQSLQLHGSKFQASYGQTRKHNLHYKSVSTVRDTGVRQKMKLPYYTSSSTVVQTNNGYKSEQEQAVTFGLQKTILRFHQGIHQDPHHQLKTNKPSNGARTLYTSFIWSDKKTQLMS